LIRLKNANDVCVARLVEVHWNDNQRKELISYHMPAENMQRRLLAENKQHVYQGDLWNDI